MDIGAAFDETLRIVTTAQSMDEGMNALLDYSAAVYPSPIWATLKTLDHQQDAIGIRTWLEGVLTAEPPPSHVKAFWFGIYNPVVDEEESRGLYMVGSTAPYSDDDPGWACWNDDSYLSDDRYTPSTVLSDIYKAINADDNLIPFGEYTLILGYASLAVAEAIREISPSLFFGGSASNERLDVGVGFDDGDYLLLGRVAIDGFERPTA